MSWAGSSATRDADDTGSDIFQNANPKVKDSPQAANATRAPADFNPVFGPRRFQPRQDIARKAPNQSNIYGNQDYSPTGLAASSPAKYISPDSKTNATTQFARPTPGTTTTMENAVFRQTTTQELGYLLNRDEAFWRCCIVVIGVASNQRAALSSFQQYGAIAEHCFTKNGNYFVIRYSTPISAQRAIQKKHIFLKDGQLIAVEEVSAELANHLGLGINPDGSLSTDGGNWAHAVRGGFGVSTAGGRGGGNADMGAAGGAGVGGVGGGSAYEFDDSGGPSTGFAMRRRTARLGDSDEQSVTDTGRLARAYRSDIYPASSTSVHDDNEIFRAPKKSSNICTKIMQFFFSY